MVSVVGFVAEGDVDGVVALGVGGGSAVDVGETPLAGAALDGGSGDVSWLEQAAVPVNTIAVATAVQQ